MIKVLLQGSWVVLVCILVFPCLLLERKRVERRAEGTLGLGTFWADPSRAS